MSVRDSSGRHFSLCVGRQLGSGGYEIAKQVSEKLGLKFYDKEVLVEAARASGLAAGLFLRSDEEKNSPSSYSSFGQFLQGSSRYGLQALYYSGFDDRTYFHLTSQTIQKLATEADCLFVGRCAEYILRDAPLMLSVFIAADKKDRIERICRRQGVNENDAHKLIRSVDKKRAAYHDFYCDKRWGQAATYDLCINTSCMGMDDAAKLIVDFVKHQLSKEGVEIEGGVEDSK